MKLRDGSLPGLVFTREYSSVVRKLILWAVDGSKCNESEDPRRNVPLRGFSQAALTVTVHRGGQAFTFELLSQCLEQGIGKCKVQTIMLNSVSATD